MSFTFVDQGTGATNYAVEFSAALDGAWLTVTNAVITPQGGGTNLVQIAQPAGAKNFYRVVGLGASGGPIVIQFSNVAFTVVEGDEVLPMLVLSRPFNGVVYYTISGTAANGDYQALTGQVLVNGTTATIPVTLTDNELIGQLKHLTLRLEAGPGYQLGADTATTIMIAENDADWQGSFITGTATLGFVLSIHQSNGVHQASLKSDGAGFFPTNGTPANISFTTNNFSVTVTNIVMDAGASLLNLPANLRLTLSAVNGVTNQSVSATQVEGAATLVTKYAGMSNLDTTNQGTFLLLKPPVAPSTNEVGLANVP